MKSIKLILGFFTLIVLSFIGVQFVQANDTPVILDIFGHETPSAQLGFVVLSAALLGMIVAGLICLYEIVTLSVTNKSLRKRLAGHVLDENTTSFDSNDMNDTFEQHTNPTTDLAATDTESTDDAEEQEEHTGEIDIGLKDNH